MISLILLVCCATSVINAEERISFHVKNDIGGRIIGGTTANAGQFPFLAAIQQLTNTGTYFCGGSLLTNQWVLTAAQCVEKYRFAILFKIRLGSNSLSSDDDPNLIQLSTETYIVHPEYNPTTLENDIGFIQLRMPITFTTYVKPIDMLPGAPLSDYSPLTALGWGQISDEDAGLQDEVHWVTVSTISNEECKMVYGSQIRDSMACAEGNFNEGTCYGDIGGPLIQYVSRGQVMHVAIASFVSQNGCESTDPSGFTRTFNYVNWIKNVTGFH